MVLAATGTHRDLGVQIERALGTVDSSPKLIRDCFIHCASVMHSIGDFSAAESLELRGKAMLDSAMKRTGGIRDESLYLTAIGHVAQLDPLLKAVELGLVRTGDVSLVHEPQLVANIAYTNIVLREAGRLGVQVVPRTGIGKVWHEPDLELWPLADSRYGVARRLWGEVWGAWIDSGRGPLLRPSEIDVKAGLAALSRFGLNLSGWFVGVHLRSGGVDPTSLRGSDSSIVGPAIDFIVECGGQPVLLGDFPGSFGTAGGRLVDARGMAGTEHDLAHLAVWSRSRFFLGNLSGGTMPPATLGTPTIWIDLHPTAHFRPSAPCDLVVPKLLRFASNGALVSFPLSLTSEHSNSQAESSRLVTSAGYEPRPCSPDEVLGAVRDMLYPRVDTAQLSIWDERVDSAYGSVGLGKGAPIAPSFLMKWAGEWLPEST